MYDNYSISSLAIAAEKNVLDQQKYEKKELKELANSSTAKYNHEEYMLTPWRFADNGWRFVRKNSVTKFLNHPNKQNSAGFSLSSLDQYESVIGKKSTNNMSQSELNKKSST